MVLPPAQHDLAGLSRWDVDALVVDDAQLEARAWTPDGGGDGLDVVTQGTLPSPYPASVSP